MPLDPRQTEAFAACVELGSFEKAAARLALTPSAISQRVRALESALGAALISRTRPCRPTRAGQRLLQHLRRAALLETDLHAELGGDQSQPSTIAIALNADSLGTWFFDALAETLVAQRILLDLTVEDQDHTYELLESGQVVGCVSTEAHAMRGCVATALGVMRYQLVASAPFQAQWFPAGLTREAARRAPVVAYTRKDTLQSTHLLAHLGLPPGAYPCHYIPGVEAHFAAIRHGLGYGMVPETLLHADAATPPLVRLAPAQPALIPLYWHRWHVQSARMETLSRQLIVMAQAALR